MRRSDEDGCKWGSHLTGFLYCKHFFPIPLERGDCPRSKTLSFSLVPKIQNTLIDMSQLCLQCSSTQSKGEITISLAFVCREPSCIKKQNSPLRFLFQLNCTSICIQGGTWGLSPSAIHPANEVFMMQALLFFLIRHFNHLGQESVLSCQSLRNEEEKRSEIVDVTNSTVDHFTVYGSPCDSECCQHNGILSSHREVRLKCFKQVFHPNRTV